MTKAEPIDLGAKVAFMVDRIVAAAGDVGAVRETRTSFVFLARDRVYKMKKPVCDRDIDFSTLAARARNAAAELRLNAELAPGVYLGIEPLVRRDDGALAIGGEGEPIEWLVVMRRLPEDRLLDRMIAAGSVTPSMIAILADRLVHFYRSRPPLALDPVEMRSLFSTQIEATHGALLDRTFHLDAAQTVALFGRLDALFAAVAPEIGARAQSGCVVEGHGDLRPEHVCLIDPPVVIDCLEFSHRLRLADPWDELGYLGLECERLGAGWIGEQLMSVLADRYGRPPTPALQRFYRAFRATLRARFALRHLLEPKPREPAKWPPMADAYLAIAAAALDARDPATDAGGAARRSTIELPS